MEASIISDEQTLPAVQPSGPGVLRLEHWIVNSYLVGQPGSGPWAVVDAGLAPFSANGIISAAETRFGPGSRPEAIILTHGHFDHVGALRRLAKYWQVPIYAHELELPYLTGRSSYPPPDPTVGGGLMARMTRVYPSKPLDLSGQVLPLPGDGLVPGMLGWRWVHTPGHSPGHVSLFRFSDRMLLAGDAFVTVKQESLLAVLTHRQHVSRPPAYLTPDWATARRSLERLLTLQPEVAATGHGIPMRGHRLREQLRDLVLNFDRDAVPTHGRYARWPAVTNETGVVSVPPPVPDPFPKLVGAGLATLTLIGASTLLLRSRRAQLGPRLEDAGDYPTTGRV